MITRPGQSHVAASVPRVASPACAGAAKMNCPHTQMCLFKQTQRNVAKAPVRRDRLGDEDKCHRLRMSAVCKRPEKRRKPGHTSRRALRALWYGVYRDLSFGMLGPFRFDRQFLGSARARRKPLDVDFNRPYLTPPAEFLDCCHAGVVFFQAHSVDGAVDRSVARRRRVRQAVTGSASAQRHTGRVGRGPGRSRLVSVSP
jgi:hypothetical protein